MEVTYRLGGLDARRGRRRQGPRGRRAALPQGDHARASRASSSSPTSAARAASSSASLELRGTLRAAARYEVLAPPAGTSPSIDAYKIGLAGVYLGVGRDKTADPVYPDVGFVFKKKKGGRRDRRRGDLAQVYGKDRGRARRGQGPRRLGLYVRRGAAPGQAAHHQGNQRAMKAPQ